LTDEIRHVSAGTKWFNSEAKRNEIPASDQYHYLVRRYFRGTLKPPFNDSARRQAGLTLDYYAALAS
jgi:uncharacterized ferritin-like protein (DUF455 family)